jgi:uncharacterized protein (DUF924 family)
MSEIDEVLKFWLPDGLDRDVERHRRQWDWWMHGGADDEIAARFIGLTERAARGEIDSWKATPRGRLALVLVLDQFSRSAFRDTPRAYAQDDAALALVLEALGNGHYEALAPSWERVLFTLPLVHNEGPGSAANCQRLLDLYPAIVAAAPPPLREVYEWCHAQARRHHAVLVRFGRHPHRNAVLGRGSTAEEQAYIDKGDFPHERPAKA